MGVRTVKVSATDQAVPKQREVLHWSAEDHTTRAGVEVIVLTIRMRHKDGFPTNILVEVIGDAAYGAGINRRVANPLRLYLSMSPKIGVAQKNIHSGRVRPHRGGSAGSLRA
jgi:hypothetical protein